MSEQIICVRARNYKFTSVLNCFRKDSVNLSRCSEAVIYPNIVVDMGETNDSINGMLLENIDKDIPINFSLLTSPVKDTPSIGQTSTISKLENYIDENYDDVAKIQLTQAILREVKQHLLNKAKEKGLFDELLRSLHNQISSFKSGIGFLRKELK